VLGVLKHPRPPRGAREHREEIRQILEAFDLTESYRDAGELAACSPNTVALWVGRRDAGELAVTTVQRP